MINLDIIAKKSGVSKATVSRIINNSASVSEEKRQKVLQVLKENNIKIPELKRSKDTKMLIGVILPFKLTGENEALAFITDIFTGVEGQAFENDYMIIIGNSKGKLDKEIMLTNRMLKMGIEGFVILSMANEQENEHLRNIQKEALPLVLVDQEVQGLPSDIVRGDNFQGSITLMNHLFKKGHRNIGILFHENPLSTNRDRLRGYQISLLEKNISLNEQYMIKFDNHLERNGYSAAKLLLGATPRPTAVYLTDPFMLSGLIQAAAEMNIAIGHDLSVVTFDDKYVSLPEEFQNYFTAISQSGTQIGIFAIEILLRKIRKQTEEFQEVLLLGQFQERQSTSHSIVECK